MESIDEIREKWDPIFEEEKNNFNAILDDREKMAVSDGTLKTKAEIAKAFEHWNVPLNVPLKTILVKSLDLPDDQVAKYGRILEWGNEETPPLDYILRRMARATIRTLLKMKPQPQKAEMKITYETEQSLLFHLGIAKSFKK